LLYAVHKPCAKLGRIMDNRLQFWRDGPVLKQVLPERLNSLYQLGQHVLRQCRASFHNKLRVGTRILARKERLGSYRDALAGSDAHKRGARVPLCARTAGFLGKIDFHGHVRTVWWPNGDGYELGIHVG
jgi:hypothetical protein